MKNNAKVKYPVSAGGVVYRVTASGVDVVLCGRLKEDLWSLPKGTPILGENLEQTAIREVSEETGLQVEIQGELDVIDYWFNNKSENIKYHKHVHFFLMYSIGGNFDEHDSEFDLVQWFPLEEALNRATYDNETNVLLRAVELLT